MSASDPSAPGLPLAGGGGGATLPDTPAAVLSQAIAADSIVGLDNTGLGTTHTYAETFALFDPGLPSGAVAVWTASSLSLSDGDPVATWAPSTGTPGSPTAAGAARPTYRATGSPSGGPCVEFDSTASEMSLSSPSGLPSGAGAGTIVVIAARCAHSATWTLNHIVQYGSANTALARGVAYNSTVWVLSDYGSELPSLATDMPRHRRCAVLGHAYDGTTRRIWVDGVVAASGAVALNTGATTLYLGRSLFGGERAGARVMTIAIYDTALTDTQWAQIMKHARIAHGAG